MVGATPVIFLWTRPPSHAEAGINPRGWADRELRLPAVADEIDGLRRRRDAGVSILGRIGLVHVTILGTIATVSVGGTIRSYLEMTGACFAQGVLLSDRSVADIAAVRHSNWILAIDDRGQNHTLTPTCPGLTDRSARPLHAPDCLGRAAWRPRQEIGGHRMTGFPKTSGQIGGSSPSTPLCRWEPVR
jgi:hypothetical protein